MRVCHPIDEDLNPELEGVKSMPFKAQALFVERRVSLWAIVIRWLLNMGAI